MCTASCQTTAREGSRGLGLGVVVGGVGSGGGGAGWWPKGD